MGLRERLFGGLKAFIGEPTQPTTETRDLIFGVFNGALVNMSNSGVEGARKLKALLDERRVGVFLYQNIKKDGQDALGALLQSVDLRAQRTYMFLLLSSDISKSAIKKSNQALTAFVEGISGEVHNLALQGITPALLTEEDREQIQLAFSVQLATSGLELKGPFDGR